MVIKRSSAAETRRLVADLVGPDPVRREAAAARLAIIGPRTIDRLLELLGPATSPADLVTVLGVLERIGDERSAELGLAWLGHADPDVAMAAVAVVRTQLLSRKTAASTPALEALTTVALDASRHEGVRVAALDALHDLPPAVVEPLLDRLQHDGSRLVRHRAGHVVPADGPDDTARRGGAGTPAAATRARGAASPNVPSSTASVRGPRGRRRGEVDAADRVETTRPARDKAPAPASAEGAWTLAAADAGLPADPGPVREALGREGEEAPLSRLHRLVVALAARERAESDAAARGAWRAVRGAAHQVLGDRGSRVALYDLRESLERDTDPLPVGMLAALERLGDQSCLDPIATAFARVTDAWQRERLREAAAAIIRRERLTRRSALLKRLEAKAGALLD